MHLLKRSLSGILFPRYLFVNVFEPFGYPLGTLGIPGTLWGRLAEPLGTPGEALGPPWEALGLPWEALGTPWGHSWEDLRISLEESLRKTLQNPRLRETPAKALSPILL